MRNHAIRMYAMTVLLMVMGGGLLLGPSLGVAQDQYCSLDDWCPLNSTTSNHVYDTWGSAANDVFAVGVSGLVLHTADGGVTWTTQPTGTSETLLGVWGTSSTDIFAVGTNGVVLHNDGVTTCSGSDWCPQTTNSTETLNAVWGSGPTDVFAVGSGGTVLHYDGLAGCGFDWCPQTSNTTQTLNDVWGSSGSDVYAVISSIGGTDYIHYDGVSWTVDNAGFLEQLFAVWGTGASNVYLAGSGGIILRSTDGGVNWGIESGAMPGLTMFSLWGSGTDDIYAVGGKDITTHQIIQHWDGSSWSLQSIKHDGASVPTLHGVWGSSAADVYAVGLNGHIFKFIGDLWVDQTSGTLDSLLDIYGVSSTDLFAVGWNGTILTTTDGANWIVQTSGTGEHLYGVWGTSVIDVFAVGTNGTVLHSSDGGGLWTPQTTNTTATLYAVWGVASNDVFALGTTGMILHYDGLAACGFDWCPQASGTSEDLYDVWGTSGTNVYAAGDNFTVLKYDGVNWAVEPTFAGCGIDHYRSIWGSGATDIYAVGTVGQICHYDGAAWSSQSSGTGQDLNGVWGSDSANVFLVAFTGLIDTASQILHSGDGGASWRLQPSGTLRKLHGVWGDDPDNMYAVGDVGTIIHKSSTPPPPPLPPPAIDDCALGPDTTNAFVDTFVAIPVNPNAYTTHVTYQWKMNGSPISGAIHRRLDPRTNVGAVFSVECTPWQGLSVSGTPVENPTEAFTLLASDNIYESGAVDIPWSMVSVPLQTGTHLDDEFVYLYKWNEPAQAYTGGSGVTTINPGEGLWAFLDPVQLGGDPGVIVDAVGSEVAAGDFDVTGLTNTGGTYAGKHFLGNPFNVAINWQDVQVAQASVGNWTDVATAAGNGWIENNVWLRYDNTAGQYKPLVGGGNDGRIYPWEGLWMHALTDIDLRFVSGAGPPPPPIRESGRGWTVTLAATAGALRDDYNAFGAHPEATDGFDAHDATEQGTLNDAHVVLSFPHSEYAPGNRRLAHDVRADGEYIEWTATIKSTASGPVTVAWGSIPAIRVVTMTDMLSGAMVVLNNETSYTYVPAPEETRSFTITAERIAPATDPVFPDERLADGAAASTGGCVAMRTGGAPGSGLIMMLGVVLLLRRRRRYGFAGGH